MNKSNNPIVSMKVECYKRFWNPFLLRFSQRGVELTLDIDQVFPMVPEEWMPIQKGKKYLIEIKEIEDDEL